MNDTVKQLVAILAVIGIFGIAYYGSFLPLRKSQAFIDTLKNISSVRSLQEFEDSFSAPLDAPSPIGQEELVRNTGNTILGLIQQNGSNPQLTDAVTQYLSKYYEPIMAKPRGLNFTQNLYVLGALNEIAYEKTGNPKYIEASKDYYAKGLEFSPKRPQFLYGLFGIYVTEKDFANAKIVGEKILSLWPTDDKVQTTLNQINSSSSTTPTK